MGKINVLGFDVANLIAAGEVVDRPASVVKELLENAIDSGADTITVEIKNGGISHIRVSDNGCGIDPEDLPLAVLRHATSKIKDARDLDSIATLGFRGEALAAIAAVTKLEIFTKPREREIGSYLLCEGGEVIDLREAGCTDGTTVIANELFYNVPARRKFLKRDATEGAKISEIVEKVALSVPDISVKYIYDGQMRFMTQGDGSLKNAIYSIYGKKCASRLVEVDRTENGVHTKGFVSDCDMTFSKRSEEIFFVNGRYIRSPLLMASLERAYISRIPQDKFPMCVLNIGVTPGAVDVNVHPTKLEIKFSNERIVSEALHYAVLTALNNSSSRPEMKLGAVYGGQDTPQDNEFFVSGKKAAKILNAFVPVENDKETRWRQASIPDGGEGELLKNTNADNGKSRTALNNTIADNGKSKTTSDNTVAENAKTVSWYQRGGVSSILAGYDLPDFAAVKNTNAENGAKVPAAAPVGAEDGLPGSSHIPSEAICKTGVSNAGGRAHSNGGDTAPAKGTPEDAGIRQTGDGLSDNTSPPQFRIIGEAYNCYVIVEMADRILIIDKHAAHERILFDRLCERRKKKDKEAQLLVAPIEIFLSEDEYLCLAEYSDDIRSVGFDFVSDAERRTVEITQVPSEINTDAALDMFRAMLDRIIEGVGTVESTESEFFEKALYQAACKAAIKGGRYYGEDHIKWLCSQLLKDPGEDTKAVKTCPHGRPVAFEIKKSSIERQFSRLE